MQHPRRPNQAVFNERSLQNLQDLTAPHVNAFSYAVTEGFRQLRLPALEFELPGDGDSVHTVKVQYDPTSLSIAAPTIEGKHPLFPRECRGELRCLHTYNGGHTCD